MSLRVAGPVSRARAWLVDALIRLAIYTIAAQALALLGKLGQGAIFIVVFALEWLYATLFEVLWHGATPGKRACKLAVLHDDGSPIGWSASFIRNTLRAVDFLPFLYGFGLVSIMLTRDYKRLGDLAAGTIVVYCDEPVARHVDDEAGAEAPPIALTIAEQRALIEYTLRAPRLTRERAEELALLATPLTGGLAPGEASARLSRIGRFLLGRR